MMKKKWVPLQMVALCVAVQGGVALAANPDNGPGCGLGKLAWSDYTHQKNIAPQVMMATTNGTFGSQTFGISFGTSGCTNDGQVMAEHKVSMFASINFENLSQEMAQGQGEHLASLATLLGIPPENHSAFFAFTQEHYMTLVHEGKSSPEAMVAALHQALQGHQLLAKVSSNR